MMMTFPAETSWREIEQQLRPAWASEADSEVSDSDVCWMRRGHHGWYLFQSAGVETETNIEVDEAELVTPFEASDGQSLSIPASGIEAFLAGWREDAEHLAAVLRESTRDGQLDTARTLVAHDTEEAAS